MQHRAAVEHGSFSAAAEALHMAQPSLSDQIRHGEDRKVRQLLAHGRRRRDRRYRQSVHGGYRDHQNH